MSIGDILISSLPRGVAQLGSALRFSRRGRWFKSSHPDDEPQPVVHRTERLCHAVQDR